MHHIFDLQMTRIFGVGVDVAQVARFQRCYAKYGDRFLRKAFHADEIAEFHARAVIHQPLFLASRWAAKEAVYKAFGRYRVLFPEINVTRHVVARSNEVGAKVEAAVVTSLPTATTAKSLRLEFTGETAALATQLQLQTSHVTLSHDGEYAVAFVVLEQHESPHGTSNNHQR